MCSFPRAVITSYHKLGGLKTAEIYSLTIWEARTIKSRYWQHHAFFLTSRGGLFLASSSLMWLLAILGISWLQYLPLSSYGLPYESVCVFSPLLIRKGLGPRLIQYGFNFTNNICKDPIPNKILGFWDSGWIWFLWGTLFKLLYMGSIKL